MTSPWQPLALASLLILGAGCRTERDIPEPEVPKPLRAWVDSMPAVAPSDVDVPVLYDLRPGLAWVDSAAPKRIGSIDKKVPVGKGISVAYEVERGPFSVGMQEGELRLTAVLGYKGRGWYDGPGPLPEVSASCGTKADELPRARVVIASRLRITPDWRLQPRSRLVSLEPVTKTERDQCEVTAARINVTRKVMEAVSSAMTGALPKLDAKVAQVDFKAIVDKVWSGVLMKPIRIQDSIWLLIDPQEARVGDITVANNVLTTRVGLTARPRIVTGPRPDPTGIPLPPLGVSKAPTGLRVVAEGRLSYPVLSQILQKEVAGKQKLKLSVGEIRIDSMRVQAIGDGRVGVRVRTSGAARAIAWGVGTPAFDTTDNTLYMPDLVLDATSQFGLVGATATVAREELQQLLREKVRIKLGKLLLKGRAEITKQLNRKLADGVYLVATVNEGQVIGLQGAPDALRARALVTGSLSLKLDLAQQVQGAQAKAAAKRQPTAGTPPGAPKAR